MHILHCNTLQHTATCCNTLQRTATHSLHDQVYRMSELCTCPTATHCNTLQHAATSCHTLQHAATHRSTLQHTHCTVCRMSELCVCYTQIKSQKKYVRILHMLNCLRPTTMTTSGCLSSADMQGVRIVYIIGKQNKCQKYSKVCTYCTCLRSTMTIASGCLSSADMQGVRIVHILYEKIR